MQKIWSMLVAGESLMEENSYSRRATGDFILFLVYIYYSSICWLVWDLEQTQKKNRWMYSKNNKILYSGLTKKIYLNSLEISTRLLYMIYTKRFVYVMNVFIIMTKLIANFEVYRESSCISLFFAWLIY